MPDAHARRVGAVIGFGESFQVIQRASCHQRHPRPPPAGTAPPSLVLLRHPRRRLGYPRAHVGRSIFIECFLSNPTVQVFQRFQGARVRHEKKRWPLRGRKEIGNAAIAAQNSSPASPSRHLRCQVSARFRPRTMTDSPALHPLHSSRSSPAFRRNGIGSMPGLSLLRSDGRKLARQSEQLVRARKSKTPMVARLRPTRTSNSPRCFARARHRNTARGSACRRGHAIGREASPGQDIGSSREHGHFPNATLRWRSVSPPGKMADLTDKTKLV